MSHLLTWLIAMLVTLFLWFVPVEYEAGGDPSDFTTEPAPTVAFIGYGTPEP
jgi:hypothetical protein